MIIASDANDSVTEVRQEYSLLLLLLLLLNCPRYSIPEGEEIKAIVIGMVTCSDLQPRNSLATEWS